MNAVLSIFLVSFAILVNQLTAFGQTAKPHVRTDALLEDLLRAHPEYFGKILESPDSFKVQIIYTQIDRDQHNQASFKNYYFHVDSLSYFYPASTVKLPT